MKIESMTDDALLTTTRGLVNRSNAVTVELLLHLGEIDARQLYLGRAFPSMFAFCTEELGFSEDVAYQRIGVARLARRLPRVLDALRLGQVHIAGLRVLAAHLNEDNVDNLLLEARGKSKRAIEEIAARLAPKPPVPSLIRKVPTTANTPSLLDLKPVAPTSPTLPSAAPPVALPLTPAPEQRPVVRPLSEDTFKVQFTAKRPPREKLKEAQALLRHAVPDGDLAEIVERALDLLIAQKKKERFAVGRKPRATAAASSSNAPTTTDASALIDPIATRHIPDPVKRTVYERDGGQCTFLAENGRRCAETSALEFDHANGFARDPSHSVKSIRLRCRAHNQYGADQMYGRAIMEGARSSKRALDR